MTTASIDRSASVASAERISDRSERSADREIDRIIDLEAVQGPDRLRGDPPMEAMTRLDEAVTTDHVEGAGLQPLHREVLSSLALGRHVVDTNE